MSTEHLGDQRREALGVAAFDNLIGTREQAAVGGEQGRGARGGRSVEGEDQLMALRSFSRGIGHKLGQRASET